MWKKKEEEVEEGMSCVKVCGRRVKGGRCMRGRRVLGGTGIGTMEWHVASASTPIRIADWLPHRVKLPHHTMHYHTTVAAAIGLTDHMFAIIPSTHPPPLLGSGHPHCG